MSDEAAAYQLFEDLMRRCRIQADEAARALEAAVALNPRRRKAFQGALLRQTFADAAELARAVGWNGTTVLRDGEFLVDQDGVLLRTDVDDRLLRKGGSAARQMLRELREFGIEPRTILDVGANIGEICVYFAARLPDARVIAFEPGPDNLAALDRNIAAQDRPPANLVVVREAVSDQTGEIEFTIGAADLSTVLVSDNLERLKLKHDVQVMRVPTDTLENYCRRYGVGEIDFLKVDIEGGEPLLADSIRALAGRIRAAYVEMSRYNSVDAYVELVEAFAQAGLVMLFRGQRLDDPRAWLSNAMTTAITKNVWFVREDHLRRE